MLSGCHKSCNLPLFMIWRNSKKWASKWWITCRLITFIKRENLVSPKQQQTPLSPLSCSVDLCSLSPPVQPCEHDIYIYIWYGSGGGDGGLCTERNMSHRYRAVVWPACWCRTVMSGVVHLPAACIIHPIHSPVSCVVAPPQHTHTYTHLCKNAFSKLMMLARDVRRRWRKGGKKKRKRSIRRLMDAVEEVETERSW